METHRERHRKKREEVGKRTPTTGTETPERKRDGEGRQREAGHRSASARHPVLSSASGPPSCGTAFTWARREGQLWPEPLCRETTPCGVPCSQAFYLAKPGWGLGQQPQRWVNERAIGVWRERTTQCDEEVGAEFASQILHQPEPPPPPKPCCWPSRLYIDKPGVVPERACPTGLPKGGREVYPQVSPASVPTPRSR